MNTEVTVALIGTGGLVLVALIGVLVELIRSRRGNTKDHAAVLVELASLHQAQDEVKADVAKVQTDVEEIRTEQGQRLARMEGRLDDHLYERLRRH